MLCLYIPVKLVTRRHSILCRFIFLEFKTFATYPGYKNITRYQGLCACVSNETANNSQPKLHSKQLFFLLARCPKSMLCPTVLRLNNIIFIASLFLFSLMLITLSGPTLVLILLLFIVTGLLLGVLCLLCANQLILTVATSYDMSFSVCCGVCLVCQHIYNSHLQ